MSTQHANFNAHAVMAALDFNEQKHELTAKLGQVAGEHLDTALGQVDQLVATGNYNRLQALTVIIKVYETPVDIRP